MSMLPGRWEGLGSLRTCALSRCTVGTMVWPRHISPSVPCSRSHECLIAPGTGIVTHLHVKHPTGGPVSVS